MPKRWRGKVDCTSCGKAKAEVGVGSARLCGHCWCMMMWGKAWADKSHPDHPHAKATSAAKAPSVTVTVDTQTAPKDV